MIQLTNLLKAHGSADFEAVLKSTIAELGLKHLPLQKALSQSSCALDTNIQATIINVSESNDQLKIKAGVFFTGIIAGCSCADDPSPVDEQAEYCEIELSINKATAETEITLLND